MTRNLQPILLAIGAMLTFPFYSFHVAMWEKGIFDTVRIESGMISGIKSQRTNVISFMSVS